MDRPVKKKIVKDYLLAEAETCFAAKGFYGTNVREITRAAGCNASAINYYFGSKEMLFLKVFQKRWRENLIDVRKTLEKTFATPAAVSPDKPILPSDMVQSVTTVFERKTEVAVLGAFLCDLVPITRNLTGNGQGLPAAQVFRSLVKEFKDVLRPFMPVTYSESVLMQTALNIMGHILFSDFVDMLTIQMANMEGGAEDFFN